MFILDSQNIPTTAADLSAAITKSLRRSIKMPAAKTPVVLKGDLPNMIALTVDVSGGAIDTSQSPPDPRPPAELETGPTATTFTIAGHPISIQNIPLQFDLSAGNVQFAYGTNTSEKLVATLLDAVNGKLSVQLQHDHLEQAILIISQKVSASTGVAIQKVSATLNAINPTTVDVQLNITAKKFMTAVVRITGRLNIDDRMVATASNLNATGEGMVGNIAVGFIRPHLQQLNGRPLPLLAFSLGKVKLRGVAVNTDDGLKISADFGSEKR